MKTFTKSLLATAVAAGSLMAIPATAQVNGIATADLTIAIANSQAFQGGYQQVATTYAEQRTTIEQRQTQRQQLVQTLDTNGDGQLDETEQQVVQDASNPTVQQIQAIDQEVQQLQAPINRARVYIVQQIAQQYSAALQQVIEENAIQMVVSPEALIYIPEAGDVTPKVIEKLNSSVPSVAAVPPADWQPSEAGVNLFQEIQQVLMMAAMQQQQQAAAQQPAAQQQPAAVGR